MEKKVNYQAPEVQVVELEMESCVLLTSPGEPGNSEIGGEGEWG